MKPIDALQSVYQHPGMEQVLPAKHYTDGFVCAIAAAPEIPMPERWMPWLIQQPGDALSSANVDQLADALMNCLRMHLCSMRDNAVALPEDCLWRETRESSIPLVLSQWLSGFLHAHQQVESDWQLVWQDNADDQNNQRLTRSLRLFSTLADIELALKSRTPEQATQLQENAPLLWRQLPQQLVDYVNLAGQLAMNLPNQFETFTKQK